MEKMRQWTILTALGVVGVLAAGWFLLVSPQRAHAKDLRAQATSQQQATATLQSQVDQLMEQKKGLPAQQRKLAQVATKVPDNPALPVLIRQLSAAAHDADVSLVSLSPSQPSMVNTPAPAGGAAAPLAQIPLSIQVSGSYFNIESFFHALEQLDRAMLVTGFTLAPNNGDGGGSEGSSSGGTTTGKLSGQINAVVFESPAAAAAAQPAVTQPTATTATQPTTQPSAQPAAAPAE